MKLLIDLPSESSIIYIHYKYYVIIFVIYIIYIFENKDKKI